MIDVKFNKSEKTSLSLETISTYEPFNNIFFLVDHTFADNDLKTKLQFKYKGNFMKCDFNHRQETDVDQQYIGLHTLNSSFNLIKSLNFTYEVAVKEDDRMKGLVNLEYNDAMRARVTLDGVASYSRSSIKFKADHNFGTFPSIEGELSHRTTAGTVEGDISLFSNGSKLKASFLVE